MPLTIELKVRDQVNYQFTWQPLADKFGRPYEYRTMDDAENALLAVGGGNEARIVGSADVAAVAFCDEGYDLSG